MFPAGHETTVNLIGNGLLLLLRHPEQRRLLREQPDLWPKAIEEILRVESPQQIAWRVATQDHELAGKRIAAGDQLMLVLGAANRDPEVFEDPERFDITRTNNRHVAFGLGRHACLGGWFARMQGQRALQAIVARFPRLSLAGAPLWHPTVSFHGLRHLPVTRAPAFPTEDSNEALARAHHDRLRNPDGLHAAHGTPLHRLGLDEQNIEWHLYNPWNPLPRLDRYDAMYVSVYRYYNRNYVYYGARRKRNCWPAAFPS